MNQGLHFLGNPSILGLCSATTWLTLGSLHAHPGQCANLAERSPPLCLAPGIAPTWWPQLNVGQHSPSLAGFRTRGGPKSAHTSSGSPSLADNHQGVADIGRALVRNGPKFPELGRNQAPMGRTQTTCGRNGTKSASSGRPLRKFSRKRALKAYNHCNMGYPCADVGKFCSDNTVNTEITECAESPRF